MKRLAALGVGAVLVAGLINAPPAEAQTRPALVRSVDEPARVPYYHSLVPTCPFLNNCVATFPAVPAGKRLRVTFIGALFIGTDDPGYMALHVNNDNAGNMRLAFPVAPFSGAFYGWIVSLSQQVDVYFEAGQAPFLDFGIGAGLGGIDVDSRNRFTISGYLVDVLP